MTRLPAVLLLLLVSGCGSGGSATKPPATQPPVPADPDSIRWVRDSAEYHAALYQVYREATARVDAEAATHAAGTWAVVLDADETVISNVVYQQERARLGQGYSSESWAAWVRRREATALPAAAAFLARVRERGGRIAIVTNRLQSECDDTAAVFKAHSLAYDAILCRPNGGPGDKNPRFELVQQGTAFGSAAPLTVVAFVGDNILDFPALSQSTRSQGSAAFDAFGVRFFLVPNPMYGSWQR
jgi:5'-nucleotidase (lipoprotein e(P4) family)